MKRRCYDNGCTFRKEIKPKNKKRKVIKEKVNEKNNGVKFDTINTINTTNTKNTKNIENTLSIINDINKNWVSELNAIIIGYSGEPNIKGNLIRRIGTKGTKPEQFDSPKGIATDGTNIYICDMCNNRIKVINKKGEVINYWSEKGSHKKFHLPIDLVIHDFKLYVIESDGCEINVFNLNGTFINKIKINYRGWCLYIYKSRIYVPHYSSPISVYTLNGIFIKNINLYDTCYSLFHVDQLSISDDQIYVVDQTLSVLLCFSIQGEYKFRLQKFNNDIQLFKPNSVVTTDNFIYISDRNCIHKLDKIGNLLESWSHENIKEPNKFVFLDNLCFLTSLENCIYVLS